ncbi:MAG: IS1595 family transposase [Melioribacteraceae bacterium]|nr:IS1595 family transposase [Melioribacteraceae bacterium]
MTTEIYPKHFQEFLAKFQTDDDCWNYLFNVRWANGFQCPKCNGSKSFINKRRLIVCNKCRHQVSITAGTIFQGTRKPLLLWFHVMWWIAAQKTGISASNFKDFMGFGSYETAWTWLHKLRSVMVRSDREKLIGDVEVDETFIGGKETGIKENGKGKTGRGSSEKTIVVVATECHGKQIGRVRFRCIESATKDNLISFIEDNIEFGSTIITDGWSGYASLSESVNYTHECKPISGSVNEAHELLPHVHMVDSLLKRWLLGTHHGRISSKHLEFYLDEFAFRFNRKLSSHRGKIFYRLVQQALDSKPNTRKAIVDGQ